MILMAETGLGFCQEKVMDCEQLFEQANTNSDLIFMKGLLQHGGEINVLLMNIGKRQAYIEVMEFIRGTGDANG